MRNSFLVCAVVLLVGCATSSTTLNQVSVGMTKAQVIGIMGQPQSTRASQGVEYLIYKMGEGFSLHNAPHQVQDLYFVRLTGGLVDSYGKMGDFDSTHPPEAKIDVEWNAHGNTGDNQSPAPEQKHEMNVQPNGYLTP